jgi:hypothetical protein
VGQRPPATPADIGALSSEMLVDSRAVAVAQEFLRYWWGLRDVAAATKDATAFPSYQRLLRDESRQALELAPRFFEPDLTLSDLLGEHRVPVNDTVAPLYGMSETSTAFAWRELDPAIDATAMLPLPVVMALLAGPNEPEPSRRGAAYLTELFCVHKTAPHSSTPPLPPPTPGFSLRERLQASTSAPACSGCHDAVDQLGFAFGRFDAVGAYHQAAQGQTIVVTATLEVNGQRITFDGVRGLVREVTSSPALATLVDRCHAAHWLAFATGRAVTTADPADPEAIQIHGAVSATGHLRLRAAIAAVTETRSFWLSR